MDRRPQNLDYEIVWVSLQQAAKLRAYLQHNVLGLT
jgi:hypothetical protein